MKSTGERYAAEIRQRVDEVVAWLQALPGDVLSSPPPDGEWTVTENAVHIVEFLPYWSEQVKYVVGHPGEPFGRTHEDAERIKWIEDHRGDDIDDVVAALEDACLRAESTLRSLAEDDWNAVGVHARRGDMRLDEIVEFFLTNHLAEHSDQARRAANAVS